MSKTIYFKATRKSAESDRGYRQIKKWGDIDDNSDDMINLRDLSQVIIDCDKKTGVFSLKFTPMEKKEK